MSLPFSPFFPLCPLESRITIYIRYGYLITNRKVSGRITKGGKIVTPHHFQEFRTTWTIFFLQSLGLCYPHAETSSFSRTLVTCFATQQPKSDFSGANKSTDTNSHLGLETTGQRRTQELSKVSTKIAMRLTGHSSTI